MPKPLAGFETLKSSIDFHGTFSAVDVSTELTTPHNSGSMNAWRRCRLYNIFGDFLGILVDSTSVEAY